MKKISNIIAKAKLTAILLLAAVAFTACSEDCEKLGEGLTQNGITLVSSTVSSLSFSWEPVDNAVQYGYRLLDADGNVIGGGVTTGTTASFTGLNDDTDYTFELTSFAQYKGEYSNSEAKTVSVKTEKIVPLDTPVLTYEVNYENVTVNWDAVENADKYYVKVTDSEGKEECDTITDTSYSFKGTVGLTYTVSVSADTELEAYSQSDWGKAEGITPVASPKKTALWTVEGTMNDQAIYKSSYKKKMTAYSDGTYVIEDYLYDGSGCDLEFTVGSDNMLSIQNGTYDSATGYYTVEYYPGYKAYIYPWYNYSGFDEDGCSLYFYVKDDYDNSGYCTFTWNKDDVKTAELWRVEGSFYDAGVYVQTSTRTLVAYADGTYKLLDWIYAGSGYDLEFSVNDDSSIEVLNGGTPYGTYIPVDYYAGGYSCYVITSGGYSKYETDDTDGMVWFYAYSYSQGYSTFSWKMADVVYP